MDPIKASSSLRILLVEDNEYDRQAFRRAFQKSQASSDITECVRGEEALKIVRTHAPSFDVVVVDYALPGMSGLDLCKELLHEKAPLPLVILTGRGSEELAVQALKAGVDDYMVKDPSRSYLDLLPVVLLGVVRKHEDRLARKRAEEALRKAHDELEQRVEKRTAKLARTTEQLMLELTERKRVEESLRLSEERFRSVAQTACDAIITVDSRGKIVFWNHAAVNMFGYSVDEAMGKPLGFLMPERFRKDHDDALKRAVSTGRSIMIGSTVEKVGLKKNNIDFPVELSLARWQTKEGVFFTGIVRDVSACKLAEEEIRHLSQQLIRATEEERKKLARDLHDELGQALTALHFSMEAMHDSLPEELKAQKAGCDELIGQVEKLGDTIRDLSSELRPDMLDDLGLVPTLEWYIKDFVKRIGGLQIDFQTIGVKKRPEAEIEIVLYRFLQEALNNIARHAKAKHVSVLLTYSHPKLIFTIKDDGVGFDQAEPVVPSGAKRQPIGLLGMRERLVSVGGSIDIRSSGGKGTVIRAELPIALREAGT
jgi:PAS domain S-box-containing protein